MSQIQKFQQLRSINSSNKYRFHDWIKTYHLEPNNVPISLIFTKSDLNYNEEGLQSVLNYAKSQGWLHAITSSKSGENVDKSFETLIGEAMKKKYNIDEFDDDFRNSFISEDFNESDYEQNSNKLTTSKSKFSKMNQMYLNSSDNKIENEKNSNRSSISVLNKDRNDTHEHLNEEKSFFGKVLIFCCLNV